MEASAHVNSLAARARILRALPGQLTPAKLADPAASLAAIRALDAFCLTAADAIDAHDAASRADRDAIEDGSEALDRFVAHVERACDPRGGGDLASRAAAATLLGRCARDCAPRRFVTSLARWGERLQGLVKPDKTADATVAAVAAARAMCEILRRAGAMMDVPGVRKEAAVVVQRALPAILAWLDDETTDPDAAAAALDFIKAALVGHPAALRPKADALERSLVRAAYSEGGVFDTAVHQSVISCVATFPRIGSAPTANAGGAPADSARAWSSTCRRALIAVHLNLDLALEGAEPMNAGASSKAKLEPAGEEPPPPIGFDVVTQIDGVNGRPSSPVALRRAIAMLRVIAAMLRASLPTAAAAPVPAELILAAARRTLDCDGAGAATAPGLPAIALRVETLAALPDAHVAAADVVVALVECGGVAMTALAGPVARLVDSCLRRGDGSGRRKEGGGVGGGGGWGTCAGVRVAMYAVAAAAARRMGAGAVAGDLAAAVVPAAARDAVLGWDGSGAPGASSSAAAAARRASKTSTTDGKKRKKGKGGAWGTAGAAEMEEYIASGGLIDRRGGVAGGGFAAATAAVRAAALDCLEAVLTSAGAALKPSVRTLADAAAAEAASAAVAQATAPPSSPAFLEASTDAQLAVRAAAYEALLASVLAPRPFRPTNLALASALFRRARTFDPALARVAGRAMLCLEAVVHPAAPPLHPRAIAPPRELLYGGGGGGGGDGGGWDGDVGGGAGREIAWGDGPSWGDERGADEEPPAKARKVDREDDEDDGEDEEMAEEMAEEEEEEAGEEEEEGAQEEEEPAAEPEPAAAPVAEPVSPTSPTRRSRRLSGGAAAEPPALDPPPAAAKKKATKAAAKRKNVAERKAEVDTRKEEVAEPKVRPSLGSGKAAVQVQLSDSDSDGELPEIVDDFE